MNILSVNDNQILWSIVDSTGYPSVEVDYDRLCEFIVDYSNRKALEGQIETAKHFRKYMISTSPFIDKVLNPYIAEKKAAIKKLGEI